MFLTRISVAHPVFATMMMIAVAVLGLFSYQRLGLDQFPNVDMARVVVTTTYPGAPPETVETEVTRRIEEALNTISGIDQVTSTSYEGRSVVAADFRLEVQGAVAAQEVRDKVGPLEAEFPRGVDKPLIQRFTPSDRPIVSIALSSASLSVPALTTIAERRVVKELGTISGVGRATLIGGQKRQIDIRIDETRLRALLVGVDEVVNGLRSGNQNIPAGSLESVLSDRSIQVQGKISEPEDFLDIIIARRGGAPIYLRDVAAVVEGSADANSRAIYNGKTALAIDILKVQDANTVAVADAVKARVARLNEELAVQDVQLRIVTDASIPIKQSVDEVQATLIEGAGLTVVIVFLFLNSWRSTVITGLTLPISIIGTLAVINFFGFTLNMLSLLGLTLSIGILIDDAIVVRENIARHLTSGKSHVQAALDGTDEIGLAVVATTAAIVAVFLPVAFMQGITGRFFFQFGVTVSAAVLISLFVSFTLDPMLSSVWHDPDSEPNAKRGSVGRVVARFNRGFDNLAEAYRYVIMWSLRHRALVLLATTAIFVGSLTMTSIVGAEFIPAADNSRMLVNVITQPGSSLDYTTAKLGQVERALKEFPEVRSVYATINTGDATGKHKATLLVELVPHADRMRSPIMLSQPMRLRLRSIAGIDAAIVQEGLGGGERPIQVSVLGDNKAVLDRIASELAADIRKLPGAVDVATMADAPRSVLSIRLRREAASDLGINVQQLGSMLNALVGGEEVTTWTDQAGETFAVVVRLPLDQRSALSALGDLMIASGRTDAKGAPVMVQLDQVAEFSATPSTSEIRRLSSVREARVEADVSGRSLGEVTSSIEALIAKKPLPPGYRIRFGGDSEQLKETAGYIGSALLMAIIFIYLVLASQFDSFAQPIAIMAALPLSLIGVVVGLLAAGSTINIFSMIGFIMLMGLVTKNGILLVDFFNQERKRGARLDEALVSSGIVRFRPIVMTTMAMIFGMLPLALATDGGGAQRASMVHAIIGGLISSTLLTLIVVPVVLSCIDDLTRRITSSFSPVRTYPTD